MNPGFVSISVFLSSVSIALASYAIEPAAVHPSRPNSCYNKEGNGYHEDGDSWQIEGCGIATCIKVSQAAGRSQMMISYESCGAVGYEPPCYSQVDQGAEYPDCCPEVICPDSQEVQDQDYNSFDHTNNELGAEASFLKHIRNETSPPPSIQSPQKSVKEYFASHFNSNSNRNIFNKERDWRSTDVNVDMDNDLDADLNRLDTSSGHFGHSGDQEEDLFTRKTSPRLFYWV